MAKNAKLTTRDIANNEAKEIHKSAEITEAYFAGLLWSNPYEAYAEYSDKVTEEEFIHSVWGFYFELGRRMYGEGIKNFDTITVHTKIKEYGLADVFKEYGGLSTINDAIDIVKEHSDNIEYYFESIKKSYTVRELYKLFGDKVLVDKGKYKWKDMNREQLTAFWMDKVNKISLNNGGTYEVEDLYIEAEEFLRKLEESSAEMLPFYNSKHLNSITQGVARGHVMMLGGFGNTGKSSLTSDKFVMSCVANKEKCLVILNEEDAQSFRQKIVLSILYHEFHTGFERKRMVNGKLEEKDKELIRKAFVRMKELIDEETGLIKLIFMERYVMTDLEKLVRYWANRGYYNLLVDTHKVSDDSQHEKRWETFVEDMKLIYRLTRPNANGLNLRTVVTFQLADSAIKNRYLTFDAIGEGKSAKNEASVLLAFRPVFSSELEGGKQELRCWKMKKVGDEYVKQYFTLDEEKGYILMFTPKNRFGLNNDGGQPVLVLENNLNFNNYKEIGWCFVPKDHA